MRNEKPTHINDKYVKECQLKLHRLRMQMEREGASIAEVATAMSLLTISLNDYIVKMTDDAMRNAQSPIVEA